MINLIKNKINSILFNFLFLKSFLFNNSMSRLDVSHLLTSCSYDEIARREYHYREYQGWLKSRKMLVSLREFVSKEIQADISKVIDNLNRNIWRYEYVMSRRYR